MVADSLSHIDVITLPDLLQATAETAPDQVIIHITAAGHERAITYYELYTTAQQIASALRRNGLMPGQVLLVALESSVDFLTGFWGAILAGLVPSLLAAEPERILAIWQALDQPALLINTAVAEALTTHATQQGLADVLTIDQPKLVDGAWTSQTWLYPSSSNAHGQTNLATASEWEPQAHDLAYLQFSSGSTGDPRGIELSHAALLANLQQMLTACNLSTADSSLSWMPYYHDMGLIAAHLFPLAAGIKQVKIDEFYFARRPAIWLETAHQQRSTLLTAAPFALDLVNRRVPAERLVALDLSRVRMLVVGAEPIVPETCRAFLDRLAPTGLAPQTLLPVYGLAEACVGVSLSPIGQGMRTHLLDRQMLIREGRAVFITENQASFDSSSQLEVVEVGKPLANCQVRIVDDHDCILAEEYIGHIQVTGPQLMRGYHRSTEPKAAFCAGWLRTGDLGFLHNGRLIITGRAKEIIIVNGHKHHAPDLEDLVRKVEGLNARRIAVCGAIRTNNAKERVVVFLGLRPASQTETALSAWHHVLPAINEVTRRLQRATGTTAIDIVPLVANQFPRTTSGKIRRTTLRKRYETGEFDRLIATLQTALAELNSPATIMASDNLEQEIIRLCAQSLGIDSSLIGAHDSVFDLGATSLQLMDLLAMIGDRFNLEPDPIALRQHPTPAGLAEWLRAQSNFSSSAKTKNPLPTSQRIATDPVAIIGMACRLPGADTPEQFWANLVAGSDSIQMLPTVRRDGLPSPAPQSPTWGSLLDTVSSFDAGFFKLEPDEAAAMDPQQRILLELAYEALERTGYAAARRVGRRVGVFIGVGEASYQQLLLPLLNTGEQLHPSTATGNMRNLIAGRIAYSLDLNGPALAIDTACSSTLVALHMARTSLLIGECDLALVGGINLNLTETPYQLLARAGALSPNGRCRAFDDAADGIVLGEGAGIIVLERQELAQRNGDQMLALIRGSAINNDGRALSPMAPNPIRQAEALQQAYRDAAIDPASVSYIEAHGTGTAIGDPTEARSLAQVFPASKTTPRMIGSVKTNVGHLLNAAGIPALIKVVLMLQQRAIPPSLHYQTPNHRFALEQAGMAINTSLQPWHGSAPLRAGVNSFGFGGTNAHVILEEAPAFGATTKPATADQLQLLTISAQTEQALRDLATALAKQLRTDPKLRLADVGFSLAEREIFSHRAALIIDQSRTATDIASALDSLATGQASSALLMASPAVRRRKIALLFTGQGAQYPQQGAALYREASSFKATFDAASQHVGKINGRSLIEWCFDPDVDSVALADTAVTQPLLVAFEIALARLVMSWGLAPDAVVGHSVGELAAAHIAGALSFENVLDLARARGQLMATYAEPGMMAAVFAPEVAVLAVIAQLSATITIAAINTPNQVVIAGHPAAVKQALERLEYEGFNAVVVNHDMAYHSPLMQAAVQPIAAAASAFQTNAPAIPLLSTVSVDWIRGTARLDAEYWAEQVIRPVRFAPAIERLISEGFNTFIEIGPGSTLAAFARQILVGHDPSWVVEALLRRGENDGTTIHTAIGRLWVDGVDFDLTAIAAPQVGQRIAIPTYPFARDRHWLPTVSSMPLLKPLELRPATNQAPLLHGQPIAAVSFQPTANGYSLQLKAADGQTLLELGDLRAEFPRLAPEPAPILQQIVWRSAEPAELANNPIQHWIIIAESNNQLVQQLAEKLNAGGQQCIVSTGESLPDILPTHINQRYGLIFAGDCSRYPAIEHIAGLEQTLNNGVLRLLQSIQTVLAVPKSQHPAGLWVITSGAYAIGNDPAVVAERALLAGLATALPDQHIEFPCVALDLGLDDPSVDQLQTILSELRLQPSNRILASRNGQRLTRVLAPLPAQNSEEQSIDAHPAGRVILIAGGAGGVGAQLARHIATQNQPKLILLGRSPLDSRRTALLAELEGLGAQAHYYQVDICDQQQVEQLIAEFATASAGIFGVIQAAGVMDVASLPTKRAEQFVAVLEPKAKGTWLLARTLARHNQRPAFFVTCSSIAAVLPGLGGGIADYVAANAFLDAFAANEHLAGRPMQALNWAAWEGIGWAAIPLLLERLRQRGLPPLAPSQAFRAFDQALQSSQSQIVVLAAPESVTKPAILQPASIEREMPSLTAKPNSLAQHIQELVGKALKIDPERIPYDTSFLALGLDSLQAVDLVKQLERSTGMVLPLTLFFEFQTISDLANHLGDIVVSTMPVEPIASVEHLANHEATFPLAPAQVAFYIGHRLYPESPAFALVRQQIVGLLDQAALLNALTYLLERHPMLRAQFEPLAHDQAEPHQRILPIDQLPAELWFEQREAPADLEALEQTLIQHQFDLLKAPLFRVVLCRYTDDQSVLFLLLHHSIADGWSTSILLDELWQVYTKQTQGLPAALPPLECTFEHYVKQTRLAATSQKASDDRAWWTALFQQHSAALAWSLPVDRSINTALTHTMGSVRHQLDQALSTKLRQHAANLGVSLFHLLLAIYANQLANWSHAKAIAINVAEHGRNIRLTGVERMVGCCADHLPLLLQLNHQESSDNLAQRVRDEWTAIQQHQEISALDLARLSGVRRRSGPRIPGAASFSLARFPGALPEDCPIAIQELIASTANASTQLSLLIWEVDGALQTAWMYATADFQPQTIQQLADIYHQTLLAITQSTLAESATKPTPQQPIVQTTEFADVLTPARILAQCQRHAERIAVSADGVTLTYAALASSANQVASWLLARKSSANQTVGLLTQPGVASIVGMVGALWAGMPWLGLNAAYPLRQLQEQLQQADASLLLYHDHTRQQAQQLHSSEGTELQTLCIDLIIQQSPLEHGSPLLAATIAPDDYAYIMFTSGSTGRPKGVPISHHALANYLQWLVTTFDYTTNDRLLQTAALSFDAAISQILGPLTSGGTVVVLSPLVVRDPIELLAAVERERPTIWRSVPSLWERLLNAIERRIAQGNPPPALAELRLIGVGGEALPASYVRRWMDIYGNQQQIVNHYGPTEATINALYYRIPQRPADANSQIPIGQTINGVITRVLDQEGNLCAPLTLGELYIGGICLSSGYLGRPDLTALQFVPDPLRQGERLYRTGDLVRELPDGNLLFGGRADQQIKLRGYRIEPAEIEAALYEHPAIAKAVVCLAENTEHPMLVAYLETNADLPSDAELRRWLAAQLPPQMIPQRFQVLPQLPTTSSGKIDRAQLRLLPIPAGIALESGEAPASPTELLVAEIWQAVLKIPLVNRHDDFFELGGDSLLLLQVLARLEGRVPVLPRAALFYQQSRLAAFASALDAAIQTTNSGLSQPKQLALGSEEQSFALTAAQTGFLLTEMLNPAAATTWCARLSITGKLDLALLQQAFAILIKRHLMLRVRLFINERPPRQQAQPFENPPQLTFNDLTPELAAGADELRLIEQYWQAEQNQPFALDQQPLLRMRVLRLAPNRHVWLIAAHHIIGDGWSTWIFGQELLHVYDSLVRGEASNLPPLRSTFIDYVNISKQHAENSTLNEHYWRTTFAKPYQHPLLQPSRQALTTQSGLSLSVSQVVLASKLAQMRQIAAAEGITLYILLLSLFVQQLQRLSASTDLVIGTAHSGRDLALPDIERLFGCFATALPIRVNQPASTFRSLVQAVATAFSNAYLHALPPAEIARIIATSKPNAGDGISAITATGAQFFFTFLDFDALGSLQSTTLAIDWESSHTEIQPPFGATELLFAARSVNGQLRLTFQAAAAKIDATELQNFSARLMAEIDLLLETMSQNKPTEHNIHFRNAESPTANQAKLDAALIGYLPPSRNLAAMLGLQGSESTVRERLRGLLFPNHQPRWFELLQTPIGTSALLCLPRFAEEIQAINATQLETEIMTGMQLAQERGVRCVSLAGMLPSLTGYGFGVLRALADNQQRLPALTTGHATTVVAVTQTVEAALKASGRKLAMSDLALVGLGSIGQAVLRLLLHTQPHPRSLILCDTASNLQRLTTLAEALRSEANYQGAIEVVAADQQVPAAVYKAKLIVAATSTAGIIAVERLQAGTIVVDDSFPPCLDTSLAIQRMQRSGDVLIVGGGQLACGPSQRTIDLPLRDPRLHERILAEILPDAAASCQLEALLWAADPSLPLTHGLVKTEAALRYQQAVIKAGFGAAPLHLQNFLPDVQSFAALSAFREE